MPDWTEQIRARLAGLRLHPAREAEIVEELSLHLDERYKELEASGLDEPQATELVVQELLDPELFTRYMRALRQSRTPEPIAVGGPRGRLLADMAQDLRLALRIMRKQAGLTAAAVLTLALGIGANGAIFALVDTVLLRDLPLPNPERVMTLSETTATAPNGRVSPLNMIDWREQAQSFDEIGGVIPGVGGMVLGGADGAENVARQWVTEGVFRALGLDAVAGRTFRREDDTPESRVAILAEPFWRARFNSDPAIVGRSLRLDGESYTVVGVVPGAAQLLGQADLWAMLPIASMPPQARGAYMFATIARLTAGVAPDAARAEMSAIAAGLERDFPATNEGRGIAITPLRDEILGSDLRSTSLFFVAIVVLVLLICFANIANLLLTRTAARSNELAIRSVLGADRRRLQRQFWTESLVLAFLGGLAGLVVAAALLRLAPPFMPAALLPSGMELEFGPRIVVFCALAAGIVGLLFSMASAVDLDQRAVRQERRLGRRTATDRTNRRRELLAGAQIATAIALLYCAGLLSRTLLELDGMDPGYDAESVLTMLVDPLSARYPTPESLLQFYDAVEDEVESLAGVSSVAWTSAIPLGPSMLPQIFFEFPGEPAVAPEQRPTTELKVVSGDFFTTLGVPLIAGRSFDGRDSRDSPIVCIVNTAMAERHGGARTAIGRQLSLWDVDQADADARNCEIVGVGGSTRSEPDEIEAAAQLYLSFRQIPDSDIYMAVRPTSGDATALSPSVRAAIGLIDTEQLVATRQILTLENIGRAATADYRFRATLVVAFATLALLLAMVGLFGVVAYSVQSRWREYGVRLALGASPIDVISQIGKSAMRLVAPGAFVGLTIGLAAGPMLGAMLFGVRPFDATTLAVVLSVLVLTAVLSIAAPALRATRVDPAETLRSE
jgi:putative ABC transport system permease protein